jgi:hypothetical protein
MPTSFTDSPTLTLPGPLCVTLIFSVQVTSSSLIGNISLPDKVGFG